MLLSALLVHACTQSPAPVAAEATTYTPVLSVKELMEHIVDPTSDWVFDAAVIDVSEKGVVETKPLTDEEIGRASCRERV